MSCTNCQCHSHKKVSDLTLTDFPRVNNTYRRFISDNKLLWFFVGRSDDKYYVVMYDTGAKQLASCKVWNMTMAFDIIKRWNEEPYACDLPQVEWDQFWRWISGSRENVI